MKVSQALTKIDQMFDIRIVMLSTHVLCKSYCLAVHAVKAFLSNDQIYIFFSGLLKGPIFGKASVQRLIVISSQFVIFLACAREKDGYAGLHVTAKPGLRTR